MYEYEFDSTKAGMLLFVLTRLKTRSASFCVFFFVFHLFSLRDFHVYVKFRPMSRMVFDDSSNSLPNEIFIFICSFINERAWMIDRRRRRAKQTLLIRRKDKRRWNQNLYMYTSLLIWQKPTKQSNNTYAYAKWEKTRVSRASKFSSPILLAKKDRSTTRTQQRRQKNETVENQRRKQKKSRREWKWRVMQNDAEFTGVLVPTTPVWMDEQTKIKSTTTMLRPWSRIQNVV